MITNPHKQNIQLDKFNGHIINEDIYQVEIFEKLIDEIYPKEYTYLTTKDIKQLLPDNWPGKKYLKNNKNIHIFNIPFNEGFKNEKNLNFTSKELEQINEAFKHSRGFFTHSFENISRTESCLFINKNLNYYKWIETLSHEFIHYFQWSSGRSKYSFKKEITNNNDLDLINKTLNTNIPSVKSLLNRCQFASYSLEIYYDILYRTNNDIHLTESIVAKLFFILQNKNHIKQFDKYWQNCLSILNTYYPNNTLLKKLLLNDEHLLILKVSGFYECGFNTLKNHIYSYINKNKV